MLPAPAVFHFPWEVNSGEVQEGESVRVFGRLVILSVSDALEGKQTLCMFPCSNELVWYKHMLHYDIINGG